MHLDLLEHLEIYSIGLHALNIVALYSNMLLLYKNAASLPDFIIAMEEAQKKAKRAKLPILDIELAMYATTSMLQSQDYKKEMDKWEGHNASKKTWTKWKQTYLAAYARGVNRRRWIIFLDGPTYLGKIPVGSQKKLGTLPS